MRPDLERRGIFRKRPSDLTLELLATLADLRWNADSCLPDARCSQVKIKDSFRSTRCSKRVGDIAILILFNIFYQKKKKAMKIKDQIIQKKKTTPSFSRTKLHD